MFCADCVQVPGCCWESFLGSPLVGENPGLLERGCVNCEVCTPRCFLCMVRSETLRSNRDLPRQIHQDWRKLFVPWVEQSLPAGIFTECGKTAATKPTLNIFFSHITLRVAKSVCEAGRCIGFYFPMVRKKSILYTLGEGRLSRILTLHLVLAKCSRPSGSICKQP